MARKKCPHCRSCYNVFWVDGKRYYHCWLCQTTWEGRDDDLHQCVDPRITLNVPVELEEQKDD